MSPNVSDSSVSSDSNARSHDDNITPRSLSSVIKALLNWVSRQSISRLFAYPRFLERELERERENRKIEREQWEAERKSLLDRLLEVNHIPQINNTMPTATNVEQKPFANLPPRQRRIMEAQAAELAGRNGA